jgi:(2Fe-2S) ferredoxin
MVTALVKGYLLPKKINPAHEKLSPIHKDRLTRKEEFAELLHDVQDVTDVVVLICGHSSRDLRCGKYGPVLKSEFETALRRAGLQVEKGPIVIPAPGSEQTSLLESKEPIKKTARVAETSHIGGHKWAGNVILYIPPGSKTKEGASHPLAACGIWYGRVGPEHVEGIVEETVLGGRVIEELFRGGVRQGGEILRLDLKV